MNNKKIGITTAIAWAAVVSILVFSCVPAQNNCGTKKQHKTRINNTKRMAPSMMN